MGNDITELIQNISMSIARSAPCADPGITEVRGYVTPGWIKRRQGRQSRFIHSLSSCYPVCSGSIPIVALCLKELQQTIPRGFGLLWCYSLRQMNISGITFNGPKLFRCFLHNTKQINIPPYQQPTRFFLVVSSSCRRTII
jgi:hypothetical protein